KALASPGGSPRLLAASPETRSRSSATIVQPLLAAQGRSVASWFSGSCLSLVLTLAYKTTRSGLSQTPCASRFALRRRAVTNCILTRSNVRDKHKVHEGSRFVRLGGRAS